MPLLDLQMRMRELGRLRVGAKHPQRGFPMALPTWRLTSRHREYLDAAAERYGGRVEPWEHRGDQQWQLVTETAELPVIVPPMRDALSQWWEQWSGGGCQVRCDGVSRLISGGRDVRSRRPACACPADLSDRFAAAQAGEACRPTTRLAVMLRDVPDIGVWLFASRSWNVAAEMQGAMEPLRLAYERKVRLPAFLSVEHRTAVRGGQTTRFTVAALKVRTTLDELLALTAAAPEGEWALPGEMQTRAALANVSAEPLTSEPRAIEAPPPPGRDDEKPPIVVETRGGDAGGETPPPIVVDVDDAPPPPPPPVGRDVQVEDPSPPATRGLPPVQALAVRLADHGVRDRAERLAVVRAIVGRDISSSKDLTAKEIRAAISALNDPDHPIGGNPRAWLAAQSAATSQAPSTTATDAEAAQDGGDAAPRTGTEWRHWLRSHRARKPAHVTLVALGVAASGDHEPTHPKAPPPATLDLLATYWPTVSAEVWEMVHLGDDQWRALVEAFETEREEGEDR